MWFFDNYILPLAGKLEECQVFGVSSDEFLNYAVNNRKEWERQGHDIVKEMVVRYEKRKNLEVGGFKQDEIAAFSPRELQYLLKRLIDKGRSFGTFKPTEKEGAMNAAQAWLDALEIYEKSPASPLLPDPTIIFPVFSGILIFLKGGKILQDDDLVFEQNLAAQFVRDTQTVGDSVHIIRALSMQCEVYGLVGKFQEAIELISEMEEMYDFERHSANICKHYGTDKAAMALAYRALWYHMIGDEENSMKCCEYVLNDLIPVADPKNILNTCHMMIPVVRLFKPLGKYRRVRDMFQRDVVDNRDKYDIKTPCRPVFKNVLMLLDICEDPEKFCTDDSNIEWILDGDNLILVDFLDNIFTKGCYSPHTMGAEICLRAARYFHQSKGATGHNECPANDLLDEKIHKLLMKGNRLADIAERKIMDVTKSKILYPMAHEIHEPVVIGLEEMSEKYGVSKMNGEKEAGDVSSNDAASKISNSTSAGEGSIWLKTRLGPVRLAG